MDAMQEEVKTEDKIQQDEQIAAVAEGELAGAGGEAAAAAAATAETTSAATVAAGDVASADTDGSQEPSAASPPQALEGSSSAPTPMLKKGSNTVANKIAAFSSGVAPVKAGMDTSAEDEILVEEVLHKLEAASRVSTRMAGVCPYGVLLSVLACSEV